MATTIVLKNSVTTTNTPSSLAQGEVAINVTDKKVWVGNAATTPIQIVNGGPDGVFTSVTDSGLTNTRLTYAGAGGLLKDSASITTNGTTITAGGFSGPLNGTVGATTASTGAFTTLAATGQLTVTGARSIFKANSETYAVGVQYVSTAGQYYIGATNSASPDMVFSNVAGGEAARITNAGNFVLGTTSSNSATVAIKVANSGSAIETTNTSGTGNYNAAVFYNNGNTYSLCGYISISGTTTSYSTTSDYRLKENVISIVNALETVSKLKPVDYTWKLNGTKGQGFIAHELQEVCPQAVVGTKDAVDEEGKPKYQGVDTSFLVAMLTKAIQELNAKVDAQAAEIAALKAGK